MEHKKEQEEFTMKNVVGIVVSIVYILSILSVSSKVTRFGIEFSRKFAHAMIGNWYFIGNYFFTNALACSVVPVMIGVVMAFSYRLNLFKGVERPGQKKSYGTVYYFVALLILVNVSFKIYGSMIPGGICFMPLAYGDAAAALVGKKLNKGCFYIGENRKSISGSAAMFVVSFLTMMLYNIIYSLYYSAEQVLILSLAAMVIECISVKGTDNLTIPIGIFLVSCLI